jgi:tubulin-specific chaperone C
MESENSTMNSVLNNMQRRDRERKLVIEQQKAKNNKSEFEGVDYFDSVFDKKVKEINSRLDVLQPGDDLKEVQEEFVKVTNEIKDLQKYFTASTLFLNDRKIQNCQDLINSLITKSEEVKTKLVPKKKFGFKNKATSVQVKSETKNDGIKEKSKEIQWTDSNKCNQVIELTGNSEDLTFKNLQNCLVIIKGNAGSIQLSEIKNCLLILGPIARSMFAENCENCTFALTCQQLRFHSSKLCNIYIKVTSRAIIEDCYQITFAPLTYTYEEYEKDLQNAGLDAETNNWELVGDFNWLSNDKQSPNWRKLDDDERIKNWGEFIKNFKKDNEIVE